MGGRLGREVMAVAAALACAAPFASCDRAPRQTPAPAAAQAAAATSPASGAAQSEEFLARLAALRPLVAAQPLGADRSTYAAYLVKGDGAPALAEALAAALKGQAAPPVVSELDVYRRRGRTMDRATGKPVKVFQVRLLEFRASSSPVPEAQVVVSWNAGRLSGGAFQYRLRKQGGEWAVVGIVDAPLPRED